MPAPSNTIAVAPRASALDITGGRSGESRSTKVMAVMGVLNTQYNSTSAVTQIFPARPPSFFRNSSNTPGMSAMMRKAIVPGTMKCFIELVDWKIGRFAADCCQRSSNLRMVAQPKLASALVHRGAIRIELAENDLLVAVCCTHDLELSSAAAAHHDAHGRRLAFRHFPEDLVISLHVS